MAVIVSAERVRELENALRELRDNIGTGWTDEQLKAFADRALSSKSGGFPRRDFGGHYDGLDRT